MAGLIIAAIVAVAILSLVWSVSRSGSLIQEWASKNGFRVLGSQRRWVTRGPFFWTTSEGQTVYRVTVEDRDGGVHHGCGSWLGGLFSSRVEARWDAELPHRPAFPVIPLKRDDQHQ